MNRSPDSNLPSEVTPLSTSPPPSPPPGAPWDQPGLWQALAADLPVVVIYTDRHHLVRWINREAEAQLGYRLRELVGRPLTTVISPEQSALFQRFINNLPLAQGDTPPLWLRLRPKQGPSRLGRLVSRPVFAVDDSLLGWVHVLHPLGEPISAESQHLAELFIQGWVRVLHVRDLETSSHTYRVTRLTLTLGQAMGIPNDTLALWRQGAMLHDIGKIAIPDNVLKKPGPLTPGEWALMRPHPYWKWLSFRLTRRTDSTLRPCVRPCGCMGRPVQ